MMENYTFVIGMLNVSLEIVSAVSMSVCYVTGLKWDEISS